MKQIKQMRINEGKHARHGKRVKAQGRRGGDAREREIPPSRKPEDEKTE